MKLISNAVLLIAAVGNLAHAQKHELRWGEFGYYSNWDRYPYTIESQYQYIDRLPDFREFPKLLEAALDPKLDQSDRAIVVSQMRTLSRCDFKKAINRNDDVEAIYRAAVAKWKEWWSTYGSKLEKSLEEEGHRFEEAWKQVAPSPYLECPNYPIWIPQSWSSTISFRSGDYQGVTEEIIEFRVADGDCSLRRRYRTGQMGERDWTNEEWQRFSQEDANHFLASLIYLIDNPWFYARDELAEKEPEGGGIGHIRGRPRAWINYYPGYEWTGIIAADQQVIINHDPKHWDTIDHELGSKTSLDGGVGIVFRLIRDLFPDPSWIPSKSRWKRVDPQTKGE